MRKFRSISTRSTDSAFFAILAYRYILSVLFARGKNLIASWVYMVNLTTMCAIRAKGLVLFTGYDQPWCCLIAQLRCGKMTKPRNQSRAGCRLNMQKPIRGDDTEESGCLVSSVYPQIY